MILKKLISILLIFLFCIAGCTSTEKIKPFEANSKVHAATDQEKRLWAQADRIDKALRKSGQIYQDEPLRVYLQQIMERLYPEFKGKIKVRLLKDPILNAFALPNGSIYVNIGLLAAMENEAQLATVLAHEGIHFTHKHSALQRINIHNTIGFANVISLLGVPFLSELIAMSSIFGYSQHHEYEADTEGYNRLVKAGYDPTEAAKPFEHLLLEVKANKIKQPFFFSTHPALEKRIENFNKFNKNVKDHPTFKGEKKYSNMVAAAREHALKVKIKDGRYNSVIAVLSHDKLKQLYSEHSAFYLGEAYRLRNEKDDKKKALETYLSLEKNDPDFPLVHKSLGLTYMKAKTYSKARVHFNKYLALEPGCKDEGFIRHYLKCIEGKADVIEPEITETEETNIESTLITDDEDLL